VFFYHLKNAGTDYVFQRIGSISTSIF